MSADHDHADELAAREPYIQASFEALACAIAHIRGQATVQDILTEMDALDGDPHPIATMAGWRGAAQEFLPAPDGATYAVAAIDPRTGRQASLDRLPMRMRLGVRMETALANKDYSTANALWQVATDRNLQTDVLLVVLMRAAAVVAHHVPAQETETDD